MPRAKSESGGADDWQKLRDDVEIIKARVSSLDRLAVMQAQELLVQDLKRVIGDSLYRAAILHLTRDELTAEELARRVGTDPSNLSKFTKALTGATGYLYEFPRGREKIYRRDEKLDMLPFESIEPFASMIERWKRQREPESE